MTREQLFERIKARTSFLCVGLDTDAALMPPGVDVLQFNKDIIDSTRDTCVAYKPNLAFYEKMGLNGWRILQETIEYIGSDHFIIADAKRGDIGNTSGYYASTFFKTLACDAVTVAPYMGRDSVEPFLQFEGKWVIALALTSNPGAMDFQTLELSSGIPLYQEVIRSLTSYGSPDKMMLVVGATRAEMLGDIRKLAPEHFLLVPGVGAQGGSLEDVAKYGMNTSCGLLVNASRSILYASNGSDYATAARVEAMKIQTEMGFLLEKYL